MPHYARKWAPFVVLFTLERGKVGVGSIAHSYSGLWAAAASHLPHQRSCGNLKEFNKGLFDYLIATDDVHSAAHDCEGDGAQQNDAEKSPGTVEPAAPSEAREFLVIYGLRVAALRDPTPIWIDTDWGL